MRASVVLALAVAAGVTASPAFAVNLITNGDFTDLANNQLGQITTDGSLGFATSATSAGVTSATGWSTAGYNAVVSVANQAVTTQFGAANLAFWDASNGGSSSWDGTAPVGNFLALDGDWGNAVVTQTISGLTVGKRYVLTFDYAFAQQLGYDGDTIQNLTVSVGSTTWKSADYALPEHNFSGWFTNGELDFTATSSSEVLSFLAYGNVPVPPFALVSDVSLEAAVPEPSTWALMLAGFAGLAFAGRLSARRKSATAA